MRKLTAWFTLGTFVIGGALAASGCGSDEGTDDDDDGGMILDGGSEGGVSRDSGTSSRLGQPCTTDTQCGSDGLLTCIVAADTSLGGGAPPKGMCTAVCDPNDVDNTTCGEITSNSYCLDFGADGYCVEGCTPGEALDPNDKCHGREEFLCTLIGLAEPPQAGVCDTIDDCGPGELCSDGICGLMVFGCLPNCGGDHDCADGLFCDFGSGLCVEDEPTGKEINETCDAAAASDECQGICLPAEPDSDEGSCSAFCNLGLLTGCGWDGSGQADAACLFATIFAPEPAAGDVGLCGQLCDCNADCTTPGDLCAPLDFPELEAVWQRTGYCRPAADDFAEEDSLSECPSGGGGGAGGAGGTGGAPAEAGAGAGGVGGAGAG